MEVSEVLYLSKVAIINIEKAKPNEPIITVSLRPILSKNNDGTILNIIMQI